jgi:hypothetical protein
MSNYDLGNVPRSQSRVCQVLLLNDLLIENAVTPVEMMRVDVEPVKNDMQLDSQRKISQEKKNGLEPSSPWLTADYRQIWSTGSYQY